MTGCRVEGCFKLFQENPKTKCGGAEVFYAKRISKKGFIGGLEKFYSLQHPTPTHHSLIVRYIITWFFQPFHIV